MTKQQEAKNSSVGRSIQVGLALALAAVGGLTLSTSLVQAASAVQLKTLKTLSRLAIALDSSVQTELAETADGFTLRLRGVTLADLYLGGTELTSFRDPRLASLTIQEEKSDVILRGVWNFAKGDAALAHPTMERFVYREKSPARFVMDFWPKAGVSVVDMKRRTKDQARQVSIANAKKGADKRRDRRIASQEALAVESDISRFCKEPLKDNVDPFLEFIPFHEVPNFAELLPQGNPDEGYAFIDVPPTAPDAKYIRLALELYAKRDYALTIRTLDFFDKEATSSIHRTDMQFLRANALLRMDLKEQAAALFEEIREKNPGTPAALASALYLAEVIRKQGNDIQAIERYLWIAIHYLKHRNVWVWRMVAAEALYKIKQTDRAVSEYEWIAENASDMKARASASLRIGDAYLFRSQYDRALAAYYRASQKFPVESANMPSAQVNRGEALYWLGQLDRAEEQFHSFLKKFPGHPAGWRALLRLGEIEGRKPGTLAAEKSRADFLETINRFPFSPGAVIARMRLIPCEDHGGFDAKSAAAFFKNETEKFDGSGEIRTERFGEFRSLIRVRSMVLLDDSVAALDAAIREKEEVNRKSTAFAWLQDMQRKLFRKQVLSLLTDGKKFEAIHFYDQYASKVNLSEELSEDVTPDQVALADPDYLLRLSRVAAELGLGRTASLIAKRYASEAKHLGLNRSIASETLEERLKKSERSFTDAKALWVLDPIKNEETIRKQLAQMSDESPFSFQKEIILGLIAEREKKWATALSYSLKASLLLSKMTSEDSQERIALDQWIASLQESGGNLPAALETYRRLQRSNPTPGARAKAEGVGIRPIDSKEVWAMREAEIAGKLGKWGDAATAYGRVVESGQGGNSALFQYALSLEKSGENETKVSELLRKVADSKDDDFWKELARKKLAGANAREGNAL